MSGSYEDAIKDCAKINKDVCIWSMFALSSVIQRKIVSLYPNVFPTISDAPNYGYEVGNTTLVPLSDELPEAEPLIILWTRVNSDGSEPWKPTHFVPLYPIQGGWWWVCG